MHACCQHLLDLHCTVDAGTPALRVMGTGQVMADVEQSHAEMFDACWLASAYLHMHTGTWAVPMPGDCISAR
jgi:hypothetical protein